MTARVHFNLQQFAPMEFSIDGVTYSFRDVQILAERQHHVANLSESVVKTQDGKNVWLTVVGDKDQVSPFGIDCGWYVAVVLSDEHAAIVTKAIQAFTEN